MEYTKTKQVLLVFSDENTRYLLEHNVLTQEDFFVTTVQTCAEARQAVQKIRPDLMVLGDDLPDGDHLALAAELLEKQPTLPIILFTQGDKKVLPRKAIQLGLVDWLSPPVGADDFRRAVERGLERSHDWQEWLRLEATRYTGPLLQQVDELQTLSRVGRAITAELHIDGILTTVVEAAMELTRADSGSILLLDEQSGELYMRAGSFQDEFVSTFRLPVADSLAGEVIRTGEPLLLGKESPQKIQTEYLVYSIVYVPLKISGETVGVLSVENSITREQFDRRHVTQLSTLADYAAVALDNANLYHTTEVERLKLQNILTQVKDGVIIIGPEEDILLINETVCKLYDLPREKLVGEKLEHVIKDQILIDAIRGNIDDPYGLELEPKKNRAYSIQVSYISGVGTVATLHDITHLKELDRVKTEFINTVSHDLRSPLTSILGYIDLINRVGEVNEEQQSFIDRVIGSVNTITGLIDDLLNLGKLELGEQEDMEIISLSDIIILTTENVSQRALARQQTLTADYPPDLPKLIGNAKQLRQVFDNLLSNAIKYTPISGMINLIVRTEGDQMIISVIDNGPGIPGEEQSRIFDKFYRASNVSTDVQGTGLGLAITKTIVEKHDGRIWVDSSKNGTIFTVVLPVIKKEA